MSGSFGLVRLRLLRPARSTARAGHKPEMLAPQDILLRKAERRVMAT